ncbi:LamG-like jellyroll fold domain-containing protein [Chryseolinea serpens]|uniref:LamG-like jellyroll fold domain-containing protein n=1 Tax=Chryseolinea serpens TaxID=947013 RepID=UPI000A00E76A|nr:LamG-like jellyroll fold domain-containing protein [Chryseolinea serpens]
MIKACVRRIIWSGLLGITLINAYAQPGQIDIARVQQMPDLPSPYLMRDWKDVAKKYDEFIFSTGATGDFLPLISLKANGTNYPALQPILLDTYVGSPGNPAEAINIIPSIVGATLVGIDKSNQNGINWAIKAKDFFNKTNGQNVYLNGYATTSGSDWWYDVMPNVYFYQLYSQYPTLTDFNEQFTTIADRWLDAVKTMGGTTTPWTVPQMNYRGFNLLTMTPNGNGVIEPESAGTIAWLLYHAYGKTGNKKYLDGAQMALEFLSSLTTNPSYELQLPYGTFMAAKMNAETGTAYDVEKMLNWSFNRGPLRGWGTIVGTWNGADVSGLIGEANDGGDDYAFVMNGFQQAAALVPLVKYDKRFARAIAKWTLNLANASRLFYSQYLPQTSQDDFAWSSLHDPQSVIAYEALKENKDGKKLYATGDAKNGGWAETNLSLYSSSSVGYLAAVVDPTDVDGILLLDVNKTDFFGQNKFPSFLAYNPYAVPKAITLPLGAQTYDLYNAISETILKTGVTGNTSITLPAGEAMLLVYLPQNATTVAKNGKLYLGNDVVDYHHGYDFTGKLRIKSLATKDALVEFNQQVDVYSAAENATGAVTYKWYVNDALAESSSSEVFHWSVPAAEGTYKLLLEINSGTASAKDSISLTVVERIPGPPIIAGFTADKKWFTAGSESSIICQASNSHGGPLQYAWTFTAGALVNQNDSLIRWSVPQTEGLYTITCEVTNEDHLKATGQQQVLVKKLSDGTTAPFAYYPLDGDVKDYSGNDRDAHKEGTQQTADARGEPDRAYKFSSGSDIIYVDNSTSLNFQNEITLSFWVKLDAVTEESFILSHGSWEERWKVSVTPTKKLRWTVKSTSGTKDLDSSFPLELDHFYHFTVVYTPYSMELYSDGVLDTFSAASGLMSTTTKAITFGRKAVDEAAYFLKGTLDEIRIYNKALAPYEIETLKSLWNDVTAVPGETDRDFTLYPNPSRDAVTIEHLHDVKSIDLWTVTGTKIAAVYSHDEAEDNYHVSFHTHPGMILLRIETSTGVFYKKVSVE